MSNPSTPSSGVRTELLDPEKLALKFLNAGNISMVVLMLVISTFIGAYFWWQGRKTSADVVVGGRSLSALPVAFSLSVNFISGITLVSTPGIIYLQGGAFSLFIIGQIFNLWITAKFFMPMFYRLGYRSSYEYLEKRFSSKLIRTICSLFFIIQTVWYMAAVVLVPSRIIEFLASISIYLSTSITFAVCMVYTSLGGLKGVLWTDVFQFAVMTLSYFIIAICGTVSVGSIGEVLDRNYHGKRLDPFVFDTDMRTMFTVWSTLIGGTFLSMANFGVNQVQVQRYVSCKSEQVARRAIYMSSASAIILFALPVFMGMIMFAYYHDCDPLYGTLGLSKKDYMLPLFVMQLLWDSPGMPGLFFACVFSGTLSTISSGLNSLAAVFMQDVLRSYGVLEAISVKTSTKNGEWTGTTRLLAIVFGFISFGFVFVLKNFDSLLVASVAVLSVFGGPVLGVFVLGMFFPFANAKGALSGLLSSTIFALWYFIGATVNLSNQTPGCSKGYDFSFKPFKHDRCPEPWREKAKGIGAYINNSKRCEGALPLSAFYDMSFLWIVPITFLLVIIVGVCVSMATTPQNPTTLKREYLSPNATLLFRWWPPRLRAPLDEYYAQVGCEVESHVSKTLDDDPDDSATKRDVVETAGEIPLEIA